MSGQGYGWDSPIGLDDRIGFLQESLNTFGPERETNLEEVTLSYLVDYATTDVAANAASPFEKKILQAAAAATDAASIVRRTQDPILDGTSRLPGDMLIGIFGVAARNLAAQASAAADTADLLDIQAGIDNSVIVCRNGALRRFELRGDEFMSYGVGNVVAVENANEDNWGVKDRGWRRITPVLLGKDQQLAISVYNGRTTAWPQAFQVLYMFQALISRIK